MEGRQGRSVVPAPTGRDRVVVSAIGGLKGAPVGDAAASHSAAAIESRPPLRGAGPKPLSNLIDTSRSVESRKSPEYVNKRSC